MDWELVNGALYFKHWLYILELVCHDLVKSLHELPTGGHEGLFCTLNHMQKDYWWPGMSTFLWKFISSCADCQAAMTTPSSPKPSPSSKTMSSFNRCLPTLLYHVYPYRSPRPSTPPCLLPTPPCLSCWWIEDSTSSWELFSGITSPTFST